MAKLIPVSITPAGLDIEAGLAAAAAAGDSVDFTSNMIIVMKNADVGSHTLTIAAPVSSGVVPNFGDQTVSDIVVAVPAAETREVVVPAGYSVNGVVSWTYDDETSVTIGVVVVAVNE